MTGRQLEEVVDYRANGPFPLVYARKYDSTAVPNWSYSFGSHLTIDESAETTDVILVDDQGYKTPFYDVENAGASDADIVGTVQKIASQYVYTDSAKKISTFDSTGRLLSVVTREGHRHDLAYDGNGLTSVSDSFGRALLVTQNPQGQTTSLTTPAGDVYQYEYSATGLLAKVIYPAETPADVTDNPLTQYLYESSVYENGLTGIVDELGQQLNTITYNTGGQALSTEQSGANRHEYVYNDSSTVMTNPLGKETTFHYADVLGVKKITQIEGHPTSSCAASNMYREYDAHGYVTKRIDKNSNETSYAYTHSASALDQTDPNNGLELTRVEAVGTVAERVISTEWNFTHRLPAKVTEPGRNTEFEYDIAGRLLKKTIVDTTGHSTPYVTSGNTRIWQYTYNAEGLVSSVDGPRTDVSDVTTYSYSTLGDLNILSNALGHQTSITSNDSGLPTEIVDPRGLVTQMEYDERQRLVVVRKLASAGDLVTQYDYDDAGQLTSSCPETHISLKLKDKNTIR